MVDPGFVFHGAYVGFCVDDRRCSACGANLQPPPSAATNAAADETNLTSFMNRLLQVWGIDPENPTSQPAADDAVARLNMFTAGQATTTEVAMVVRGIKGEVILIPADFGPCESIETCQLALAEPLHGNAPLVASVKDKIVVFERGVCTFASKIQRAQDAGARAVIIIQTFDVWPYTMTDSKGEGVGLSIPAFMISKSQGHGLLRYIQDHSDAEASIDVRKNARECVICQVDVEVGAEVVRMPCQHVFHTECIKQWLKIRNSCPICRVEIPAKNPQATSAQRNGDFLWSEWMS
ncbi:hypothetical protein LEN26_001290 [Aphanomyces euteiches]|nr:hypothetical protein AeMF1_004459 [Aphanomyces euteiches]KAH9161722.1 hypothetical protein LEN26_001290 [Aphanomyces euteiches]KAH9186121.1 hypothetical protein AeNC1_011904 [Aphanomyces euteiches]